MEHFNLKNIYRPAGDQPEAIRKLTEFLKSGNRHQTLLGVTGSGKTFTMANVIKNMGRPALVISHNKTLAAQLYQEFKNFFPENAVHYFVSYYDYYQPEAYIPQSDTYIEKDAKINDFIDAMRHATTATALTRNDFVIVASVSCIYGIGDPIEYGKAALEIKSGMKMAQKEFLKKLAELRYERNDYDIRAGIFKVRGESVEIVSPAADSITKIEWDGNVIDRIVELPVNFARLSLGATKAQAFQDFSQRDGARLSNSPAGEYAGLEKLGAKTPLTRIFPAKHFVTPQEKLELALKNIELELGGQLKKFKKEGKPLEAERLSQRTNFDLKMLRETGFTNGIENYSRQLSFRSPGEPPSTLLDYLPKNFVTFIDESHMTIPQIRGMYFGDRARKETLVNYGFRLPSAIDNRPLKFEEFNKKIGQVVYVSATPADYEMEISGCAKKSEREELTKAQILRGLAQRDGASRAILQQENMRAGAKSGAEAIEGARSNCHLAEQIIRPTGLLDPRLEIRNTTDQIKDVISEIKKRVEKNERVIVTTLTKRMAEDLADYLKEANVKAEYLHSDIKTIERHKIITDLRKGTYDVIVGINLLREGIDLPEVSLVIILDADKEGFLRNAQTLIQTIGRAARHTDGTVIMYADTITGSMKQAMEETERRRKIQEAHNKKHGLVPVQIQREITENIFGSEDKKTKFDITKMSKGMSRDKLKQELEEEMLEAAKQLNFEKAAEIRDAIRML